MINPQNNRSPHFSAELCAALEEGHLVVGMIRGCREERGLDIPKIMCVHFLLTSCNITESPVVSVIHLTHISHRLSTLVLMTTLHLISLFKTCSCLAQRQQPTAFGWWGSPSILVPSPLDV